MAKPPAICAPKVRVFFLEGGHLHIELCDFDGDPIASIDLEFEDGVKLAGRMANEIDAFLPDDGDTIH